MLAYCYSFPVRLVFLGGGGLKQTITSDGKTPVAGMAEAAAEEVVGWELERMATGSSPRRRPFH